MVTRPFHPLLKDTKKHIREAGRCISPTNVLKVIGLGDKITVSDLAPPNQPKTCMLAVYNGRHRNTCNLEHQAIADAHAKNIIQQVGK